MLQVTRFLALKIKERIQTQSSEHSRKPSVCLALAPGRAPSALRAPGTHMEAYLQLGAGTATLSCYVGSDERESHSFWWRRMGGGRVRERM